MKKTIQASRKTKIIVSIIVALILVGLFVFTLCFSYNSDGANSNFFTIISGWISFIATTLIGGLTIYLTIRIERESKRKDELRRNELKEEYVNDLKLKANPVLSVKEIKNFSFFLNDYKYESSKFKDMNNFVLDDDIKDKRQIYNVAAFFLSFNSPKVENIEKIYIKKCKFTSSTSDEKDEYTITFKNYSSSNKTILSYNDNVTVSVPVYLSFTTKKKRQIFIDNVCSFEKYYKKIQLDINLIASNTLGLSKSYRCLITFIIAPKDRLNQIYSIKMVSSSMCPDAVKYNIPPNE